jgi:hypothetical protein
MTDHTITWDHQYCDHEGEDCTPTGTITCNAVGEGEMLCRLVEVDTDRGICESWSICDLVDAAHSMSPDFEHHDPGGQHCTEGHPLRVVDYCNALLFIDATGDVRESYIADWPTEFIDGPVDIEWTGDAYLWSYPLPAPSLPLFEVTP